MKKKNILKDLPFKVYLSNGRTITINHRKNNKNTTNVQTINASISAMIRKP